MAVKSLRICDVCETEYTEENPGWMIMSVPNAPEEMGPVEYDLCSFDCLHSFVTSPDEDEVVSHEETAPGQTRHPELQNPSTARRQPQERPPMTLMEAVAMGIKPGPHGG